MDYCECSSTPYFANCRRSSSFISAIRSCVSTSLASLLPSHHSVLVLLRHWMQIFCAKCKSQEALLDNDIILCDGACNRGFHQYCLDPPLATINSKSICCNLGYGRYVHKLFSSQNWSSRGLQITCNVTCLQFVFCSSSWRRRMVVSCM